MGQIVKIITKEKFEKALSKGNYRNISSNAQAVIDDAAPTDMLELTAQIGSPLSVITAKKINETRFMEILLKKA